MDEQKTAKAVRILIVDDHDIVRRGLITLMSRREEFDVVGEAGTAADAVLCAEELSPDVVVMDIRLPDGTGIEMSTWVAWAYLRIAGIFELSGE